MSMTEKLIRDLQELRETIDGYGFVGRKYVRTVSEAIEMIGEPSEKAKDANMKQSGQYYNGGWIPCNNALPDDGEKVLCTDGKYVYLVEFEADLEASFGDLVYIIAWMPLPEPYREETDHE